MQNAAGVWRGMLAIEERASYLPALAEEIEQARSEAQRALFAVLSMHPGWAGKLTAPLEDALVQ